MGRRKSLRTLLKEFAKVLEKEINEGRMGFPQITLDIDTLNPDEHDALVALLCLRRIGYPFTDGDFNTELLRFLLSSAIEAGEDRLAERRE